MLIIPIVLIIGLYQLSPSVPHFNNAEQLADWAACDVDKIAYGVGQSLQYKVITEWEDSDTCILRGTGDCKCHAVVAEAALRYCGMKPRILVVKNNKIKQHAVTVFENYKGEPGYINGVAKIFDRGTDLNYVAESIPGGPWEVENKGTNGK